MNYPIGMQSFSNIRRNGYLYVDKTAYIPLLLQNGRYKFLSRPRRFGKSLLVSMLESFFSGERELFNGLKIDRLMPEEWESHPVIHLDFSGEDYVSAGVLDNKLHSSLERYESAIGIQTANATFSERFRNIVRTLHASTGRQVVVLVDEYDNPITAAIGNPELQERFRATLYGFYSSLKSLDEHLHFCLLTGVTKYGHLSVFSGLNNLLDITFMNEFAGICGITEEELRVSLKSGVEHFAEEEGIEPELAFNQLKEWYDGYHFSKSLLDVYNPFSVMNTLARREISGYWYQTGTPTILIKMLTDSSLDITKLNGTKASDDMLGNISATNVNPTALFYQTGYLTIKNYDRSSRLYTLGYPNKEIESGLMDNLLNVYGNISDSRVLVAELKSYLERGEADLFIKTLREFFANIPFDLRRNVAKYENYYHTVFYVLLRLIGMDVDAEYHTSEGSIDLVIKTSRYIYIIELKINGSAQEAIEQIDSRNYSAPFANDSREIIKLGIGFAEHTHTIDSFIAQKEAKDE
jgi:hypothetical protein